METLKQEHELYFDPFAEEGDELFDPSEAFAKLEERYSNGEIEHDYSADNFVNDTEALMLDAAFVERFDAVQAIAARLHELCGEDHNLSQAYRDSSLLSMYDNVHSSHDGHDHDKDDEYEIDPVTRKKTKKKRKKKLF